MASYVLFALAAAAVISPADAHNPTEEDGWCYLKGAFPEHDDGYADVRTNVPCKPGYFARAQDVVCNSEEHADDGKTPFTHCTWKEILEAKKRVDWSVDKLDDDDDPGRPPSCECGTQIIDAMREREQSTHCDKWGSSTIYTFDDDTDQVLDAPRTFPNPPMTLDFIDHVYEANCALKQAISLPSTTGLSTLPRFMLFGMVGGISGSVVTFFTVRRGGPITVEPLLG